MRLWLSFLIALLLIPVALVVTGFITRSITVGCRRSAGHVSCTESEHIGPYPAHSATIENVKIARSMGDTETGLDGVVVETEAGDNVQLTSTFLDQKQQNSIAGRIHQFLFLEPNQTDFSLSLPISINNLGLGLAFTVLMVVWAAVSAFRIVRRARKP